MKAQAYSLMKHLVLIGGGHSSAIALKLWGLNPIPGINLTLISDVKQTPYSGMLPGLVAGFYTYQEAHINLETLAQFAQAKLIIGRAIGLDLEQNRVIGDRFSPIPFNYLSIDIGSTPNTISVPGAQVYATPAKPVPQFLQTWNQLLTEFKVDPRQPLSLGIVGGGAGGVELALNMQHQLEKICREARQSSNKLQIHLFHQGKQVLSGHNSWVSNRLEKILIKRDIQLHLREKVKQLLSHQVICESGLTVECDYIFWVTQASAPSWIKESGLAVDNKGFILVKDTLQSASHSYIFAAGDIATMENYSRPKAGVFAVRQGKPLFTNWQNLIKGQSLISYIPQKRYLALIGTGDQSAIASWGSWGWQSPLLWWLKDYIDRKFMNHFHNLSY
jgi:pyridine nucleotide-disulfide oxidoreductase family protein